MKKSAKIILGLNILFLIVNILLFILKEIKLETFISMNLLGICNIIVCILNKKEK